jgi:glycosyltransferase involved in cell wall biosynthesis
MRILFLSSVFPQPSAPARGIYCRHLCEALAANHQVRVVAPRSWLDRWRHGKASSAEAAGLEVECPTFYYPPGVLRGAHGWLMWRSVRRTVNGLLEEFRPDCVLSYWAYPDGACAVRAARAAGVSAAILVGGSDVLLLPPSGGQRRRVAGTLAAAGAVITVSEDLRAKVLGLGIEPGKVHTVRQGIDRKLFSRGPRNEARQHLGIPEAGKVLLWVGRMVPVKGLDVLLDSCTRLRACGSDFRLYLVGDGPLQGSLQEETRRRGLTEAVFFVGPRRQEQLPDWYRAADLTVLPSRSEGIPNVLRESMACGTPFVASRVGGIPELSADPANRLVPANDPAALASALGAALSAPAPGELQFCQQGWDQSAEAIARILQGLTPERSYPSERRKKASRFPLTPLPKA